MATRGENEGIRVLEEFGCDAISTIAEVSPGPGFGPGSGPSARDPRPPMGGNRSAELRSKGIPDLLVLVREGGPGLSREELLLIHEIAAERLSRGEVPPPEGLIELSREAMLIAVNRIG